MTTDLSPHNADHARPVTPVMLTADMEIRRIADDALLGSLAVGAVEGHDVALWLAFGPTGKRLGLPGGFLDALEAVGDAHDIIPCLAKTGEFIVADAGS